MIVRPEGRSAITPTTHRTTAVPTTRSRRPGGSAPRRPSERRAATRRAALVEQEVTLAFLRELTESAAQPPARRPR